uniref:(northern house mosquito) hypothetical protein n=1 Tax=Culex pipiens TaxID=7175 RepID=A0A8D8FX42_CULPI
MRHRNFPPPFAEWNLPRSRAVYPDDDVRRLWRDAPRSTELPQVGLAHLVPPVRARRLRERDLRRKPGHDGLRAEAVLPLSVPGQVPVGDLDGGRSVLEGRVRAHDHVRAGADSVLPGAPVEGDRRAVDSFQF